MPEKPEQNAELKPCPFCGRSVTHLKTFSDHADIFCDCGATIHSLRSYSAMKADWNTRPIEDALRAEIERLRAELTAVKGMDHSPHFADCG